jgi:hypothetical protein
MVWSDSRVDFDDVETCCDEELADDIDGSSSASVRAQESKQRKVLDQVNLMKSPNKKDDQIRKTRLPG